MTAKLKKILLYVGVSAAGIFSVFLLFSFITDQMKLIQVLSPPSAASPDSESRSSRDFPVPESLPPSSQNSDYGKAASPANAPDDRTWGGRQAESNRNPNRPSQFPSETGANWPAGLGDSQGNPSDPASNPSGLVSSPSESGSGQNQNPATFTPPPRSWNKPFIPYKGYKEGEQPPWARPTKYVTEIRKNDPNFNLLDSLDKRRKEIMEEREREESEQNR